MQAKQIQITNRLHSAIQKYSDDTVLWMKDKTGQEAEPQQIVFIKEIENNPRSLIVEPPRAGKTWAVEAVCLKELACNERENELIFGPVQKQAKNALKEQLNWIETSPILSKYIATRRGKPQISDSKYEFVNRSRAEAFGIHGSIDSEEASILRGEEFDDMDMDVWTNRVIQRGGRKNISGLPLRIRLSGTIQWGNGPIYEYSQNPDYHLVTQFDIYALMALEIYDELAIEEFKAGATHEQWLRIYLLKFTDSKNFIWESSLHNCLLKAMEISWQGIEYIPGKKYKPHGVVYAGFDMGHSGEGKVHSVYRADFIEVIGNTHLWLGGMEWESTEDPDKIEKDFCDLWEFYGVHSGRGDALKSAMIAKINDRLFDRGLIDIDRSDFPENKPSEWEKWAFSPAWNTGKAKYIWGSILKSLIDHTDLIIPYFDRKDDRPIAKMAKRLRDTILNIRIKVTNSAYPSLEIVDKSIGDDPFDAINMAVGEANDQMIRPVDFSQVGFSGRPAETASLAPSVIRELQAVGSGTSFADFGIN